MPSYLSSTHTGDPRRARTSSSSATGEASIDLSGRKRASSALAQTVVAGEQRSLSQVAGEHARPLHIGQRPIEGKGDRLLEVALTQTRCAGRPTGSWPPTALSADRSARASAQDLGLGRRATRGGHAGERIGHVGQCRWWSLGRMAVRREQVAHRLAQVR
jgi:hypothetical protein